MMAVNVTFLNYIQLTPIFIVSVAGRASFLSGGVAHTAGPYPYLYMRHEMTWSIAQTPGWDASPF